MIHIEVTAEDIHLGERKSVYRCPIARGASRAMGTVAGVSPGLISRKEGELTRLIEMPEEATQFMMRFDQGDPVEPFAFDLDEGKSLMLRPPMRQKKQ